MDQSALVGDRIDEGRRLVERFAADGNAVRAAFWVQTAEDGLRFLYMAVELYDQVGPAAAYRAIHASLRKLGDAAVPSSSVKLISPSNPIAVAVLDAMARHSGKHPLRLGQCVLGALPIQEGYVYPRHFFSCESSQVQHMTRDEIAQILLGRSEDALRVLLKDGTAFSGRVVSFSLEPPMLVGFRDGENLRTVRMDEISSIAG